MKIRLDRLGDKPFEWQETLPLSAEDLEIPGLVALGEVRVDGRIARIQTGFLFSAAIAYEQTLSCTRCLSAFEAPVEARVDLLVVLRADQAETAAEELEEDDLGMLVLDAEVLDTRAVIEEQIQLNVPMKPLCRADCAGLCGRCGADLNAGACDCRRETDPRWSALAALKTRLDGD